MLFLLTLALADDTALGRLDTLGRAWWGTSPDPEHSIGLADAARADPTTWLALQLILSLAPSDRWRVNQGQTYVQTTPTAEQLELLNALGAQVDVRRPKRFEIRTEANTVVWVSLVSNAASASVPVAWPTAWRTVEAQRAIVAAGWTPPPIPAAGLVDPSFEDPIALRVAWNTQGVAVLDSARTTLGASSVRIEGEAQLTQRVAVQPGVSLTLVGTLTAQGSSATLSMVFEDAAGAALTSSEAEPITTEGWQARTLTATAPSGASAAAIHITTQGEGFANVDDLRLSRSDLVRGQQAASRVYEGTSVRVIGVGDGVDACGKRVDQTVRSSLGLLGLPTDRVDVTLGASVRCEGAVADAAQDALQQILARHWGQPGGASFSDGLTRALSGASLPDARGPLTTPDAWTNFARWLLDAYGTAAVRAAWQGSDLADFRAGNQSFADLQKEWRGAR